MWEKYKLLSTKKYGKSTSYKVQRSVGKVQAIKYKEVWEKYKLLSTKKCAKSTSYKVQRRSTNCTQDKKW